ncbi:MAG: outer membrane beta-barrel protein, partial [Chitinophagaceae bacterium]
MPAQVSLENKKLTWSGFVDAYYSLGFGQSSNHEIASFLYNHNRHNEVNINLALMSLSYKDSTTRANFSLMAGTYPQYNLAAEPELFRHIYEANAGVRLARTKEIWIDAGILPSHIGFETAISKDCSTLTRSL